MLNETDDALSCPTHCAFVFPHFALDCCGPIAQRSEPPAHNRPVPGSNPGGPIQLRRACMPGYVETGCDASLSRRSASREGGRRWTARLTMMHTLPIGGRSPHDAHRHQRAATPVYL